jgi:hypothetical protein
MRLNSRLILNGPGALPAKPFRETPMTDTELDQLVFDGFARAAECRKHNDNGSAMLILKMADALTAERARVAELEAFRNGYKDYIRKLQDSAEAERKKVAALEAEVARWREVAGELSKMLELSRATCLMDCGPVQAESWSDPRIEAALARFKQESGQ